MIFVLDSQGSVLSSIDSLHIVAMMDTCVTALMASLEKLAFQDLPVSARGHAMQFIAVIIMSSFSFRLFCSNLQRWLAGGVLADLIMCELSFREFSFSVCLMFCHVWITIDQSSTESYLSLRRHLTVIRRTFSLVALGVAIPFSFCRLCSTSFTWSSGILYLYQAFVFRRGKKSLNDLIIMMKRIRAVLNDATEHELKRSSICVICRLTMRPGSAKILPCHHCFHAECLESWMAKKKRCPLCQADLSFLCKGGERPEYHRRL
jgi:hypothetical protein